MIDTTNGTTCQACGRSLVHIPGHRKKAFCNDACRQRHHRSQKEQQAREAAQAALQASTGSYLPQTRAVLEEVMRLQGMELAGRVAAALADEITQTRDAAYNQFAVLQAEHAALQVTVRELHMRLDARENVDECFRMDTQVRPFGSWLQKHARYYAQTPFGKLAQGSDKNERGWPLCPKIHPNFTWVNLRTDFQGLTFCRVTDHFSRESCNTGFHQL